MTKAKFGFSSVVIDSYRVYTCKIIVDNPVVSPTFEHKGIVVKHNLIEKYSKKLGGRHTVNRYSIRYCTMDWKEKFAMQQQIGMYLRNNAVNKLYQKWDWLQEPEYVPSPAVEEVELELPTDEDIEKFKLDWSDCH